MYRIMIVDDEMHIVEGICSYINALEKFELDVYKAHSAKEALEQFARARFDIVVTDIEMPEMNGIEFVNHIVEMWPSCKIIFLTGYDKFEYVQTALKQNAIDYILKIDGLDAVKSALEKAIRIIEKETEAVSSFHEAQRQMSAAADLLQRKYLSDIIMDEESPAEDMFVRLEMPFDLNSDLLILVGRTNCSSAKRSEYETVGEAITSIMLQTIGTLMTVKLLCIEQGWYLWLIQDKSRREAHGQELEKQIVYMVGMMEKIQDICEKKYNIVVSFAMNKHTSEWNCLKAEYDTLKIRLQGNSGNSIPHVDVSSCVKTEAFNISLRLIKQMELDLEQCRPEKFMKAFDNVVVRICQQQDMNDMIAMECYLQILGILFSAANKYNLSFSNNTIKSILNPAESTSWSQACGSLRMLAREIFSKVEYNSCNDTREIINKINKCVEENYGQDLSLIYLSEYVHLNPVYLSRLYKEKTGKTLSSFITNVRIEKSKKLLSSTDLKISDISGLTGYDSSAYFSNVFRKETGMSPQDYRKINFK